MNRKDRILVKGSIAVYLAVVVAIVVGVAIYFASRPSAQGKYDDFARCLKDKGVILYGAFWCPHCQAQKAMFGSSAQYLPYVECSTPDSQSQTAVCAEKGIAEYPTLVFADGSKLTGEATLKVLAQRSGCDLYTQ